MLSLKPYLITALYNYILDSSLTPYILIDTTEPYIEVPVQFIKDNKITLNISPTATTELTFEDGWIMFSARFGGKSVNISFPIHAVLALYAKENGQGMVFVEEENTIPTKDTKPNIVPPNRPLIKGKPMLRIVK